MTPLRKIGPGKTALVAAALALAGWWASGELPGVGAPPPKPGDCDTIGLWSNGYHTSLSMRADQFPPDHPLRKLYPAATHLMIGWGDLAFYRSRGDDLWLGLQALAPGGESGMHVLAGKAPVETWYIGKEVQPVALSTAGVRALVAYISDSLVVDARGWPSVVAYEQDGFFLRAHKDFHALNVCNHWTTRAMRRAGVPVNAALAFTGDMAVKVIGSAAPASCG